MTEREKLIELIQFASNDAFTVKNMHKLTAEVIADYLLQHNVVVLPCKVGDVVYEIIEDTIPEHHCYIEEYEVQDVSTTAVMYADDWTEFGYPNLYFTKEDAEKAVAEK